MAKYLFHSRNLIFLPLNKRMCTKVSDLSKGGIIVTSKNPFDLFNEWVKEASKYMTRPTCFSFVLSNYSPKNKVTSRVMKYVLHEDEKFIFVASERTEKIVDLRAHPDVSMCCWWYYTRDKYFVMRQIRIQGKAIELDKEKVATLFAQVAPPLQVEFLVSNQNVPVKDWFEKQNEYVKKVAELKNTYIKMPPYMTAFQITTEEIQFFHAIIKTDPFFLADRVLFKKDKDSWNYTHIGA